jgi:hypothetical protein
MLPRSVAKVEYKFVLNFQSGRSHKQNSATTLGQSVRLPTFELTLGTAFLQIDDVCVGLWSHITVAPYLGREPTRRGQAQRFPAVLVGPLVWCYGPGATRRACQRCSPETNCHPVPPEIATSDSSVTVSCISL